MIDVINLRSLLVIYVINFGAEHSTIGVLSCLCFKGAAILPLRNPRRLILRSITLLLVVVVAPNFLAHILRMLQLLQKPTLFGFVFE